MASPKTEPRGTNYIFLFTLMVHSLALLVGSNSTRSEEKGILYEFNNNTSNKTGNYRPTAMDLIIAINRNTPVRKNYHKQDGMDAEITKRMSVTKLPNGTMINTNTSDVLNSTDVIIEVNKEEKVADHLLEGDILLDPMDPTDYKIMKLVKEDKRQDAENRLHKRQATRSLKHLWHKRIVPYRIDFSLGDYQSTKVINDAIAEFNSKSCVKFMPYQGIERDYVIFIKNDGCSSSIGRTYYRPGFQHISIDDLCKHKSIIMHEMLHCVGFYHEQSRPDRDEHLKILWENINPDLKAQFEKYDHGKIDQFGFNYNYQSLMQYGRKAFSRNDGDTMQAISNAGMELGGEQMSNQDVTELNTLYDCKTTTQNTWTSWSAYSECDKHCYKSRQRYCYGRNVNACGGNPNQYGIENDRVKCPSGECPAKIDGHWGDWSPYGPCSKQCNEGVRKRQRTCNKPLPRHGGKACSGLPMESILCVNPSCSLGPYDTDFRGGHMGNVWKNDIYDTPQFDWTTHRGATNTEGTGPYQDHLGNIDYYLYVESSSRAAGDNARIFTGYLSKTNGTCFSFYYHMLGQTTGTLTLSIFPTDGSNLKKLFSVSGSQGSRWHFQRVDLKSPTSTYQLIFEAIVANGDYSDIAVDDLFFNSGSCDCQNNFRNCEVWAERDDCAVSYTFMMANCKKACNFCTCVDKNPSCKKWAATQCKRTGEFSDWMDENCPVTCGRCYCRDEFTDCAGWAKKKECQRNPKWMREHCERSCGVCRPLD